VLLVAGGLGIAPLKSLINHIHDERHDFGKVTILPLRDPMTLETK
jgi:NAD(P)H-flavin reductase